MSYQKQPVSVNKASIAKESYEYMNDIVKTRYNVFKSRVFVLDFLGYDTVASENFSFTFAVRSAADNGTTMIDDKGELRYLIKDVPKLFGAPNIYGNNVLYGSQGLMGSNTRKEEYEKSEPITYFESDYFKTNRSLLNFI